MAIYTFNNQGVASRTGTALALSTAAAVANVNGTSEAIFANNSDQPATVTFTQTTASSTVLTFDFYESGVSNNGPNEHKDNRRPVLSGRPLTTGAARSFTLKIPGNSFYTVEIENQGTTAHSLSIANDNAIVNTHGAASQQNKEFVIQAITA